jgi:hypothetical protein
MNHNSYPAIGIDKKILLIQNKLSSDLGFSDLQYYGRAHKAVQKDGKTILPECYLNGKDGQEVYFSDIGDSAGNVFFLDTEDHSSKNGTMFTANIKIVFMLNLLKLYGQKTYRADSEVQDHCVKFINKLTNIRVTGVSKGVNNVLKDYSTAGVKFNDVHPFHIFSVNGTLNYIF